ncbi:MAG: methyltransferase domain-containing protein [Sedimentisphaerales bacterium]|nr:methyltransferase domain-containing protein [Sedimentisphaerales bacterium]
MENDRVREGKLYDPKGKQEYPILNFVPRFVKPDNYAASFGFEWNVHIQTQHDHYSGVFLSRQRFEQETRWPQKLHGEFILEAGCGAGRFTSCAAETGATVVSFDYSAAVEANYRMNGHRENVLIVQADIYQMPFQRASFDRVFCLGVLQHTPNPEAAFRALVDSIKPGGAIVTDIYIKDWVHWLFHTKTYIRPITCQLPPSLLYRWVRRWVNFCWPLIRCLRRLGHVGQAISWRLLVADFYRLMPQANDAMLREWAYLDTFDMLSPRYDKPQAIQTFRRWYEQEGLAEIDIRIGYNGIIGKAVRPQRGQLNTDMLQKDEKTELTCAEF